MEGRHRARWRADRIGAQDGRAPLQTSRSAQFLQLTQPAAGDFPDISVRFGAPDFETFFVCMSLDSAIGYRLAKSSTDLFVDDAYLYAGLREAIRGTKRVRISGREAPTARRDFVPGDGTFSPAQCFLLQGSVAFPRIIAISGSASLQAFEDRSGLKAAALRARKTPQAAPSRLSNLPGGWRRPDLSGQRLAPRTMQSVG